MRIYQAKINELNDISNFIRKNWKKNHILASNKSYFSYLFKNKKKLNFIICRDNSNSLIGILGFIKSSYTSHVSIWTSMWMVKKKTSPMLGIKMLMKLIRNKKYNNVMSVGINKKTIEIYNYLGFHTGKLNHYFIPNLITNKKVISKIPKKNFIKKKIKILENVKTSEIFLEDIKNKFNFNIKKKGGLYKDFYYFKKKFLNNPINDYRFYGVIKKNKILGFAVVRLQKYKASKCLRILDFYGNQNFLKNITYYLLDTKEFKDSEYLDFYNYGFKKRNLDNAGFYNVANYGKKLIIPDLFGPFIKKNNDVFFFINKNKIKNIQIFRADGDQDMPVNKKYSF